MRENKKNFIIAVFIVLLYCAARFFVYSAYSATDFQSWLHRDSIMDIPRFVAFLCVLIFTFSLTQIKREFSPSLKGAKEAFVVGSLLLIPILARSAFVDTDQTPVSFLFVIVLNSFIVGFFEETLFRGALFGSLKEIYSSNKAILISSVVFTAYHVQAQPLILFPVIFLMGVLFALLRRDGMSLFWLAMIHAVYDSLILFCIPSGELTISWQLFECVFLIALMLGYQKYAYTQVLNIQIIRKIMDENE